MTRVSKKTIVGVTLYEAQEAANAYAQASLKKDSLTAALNENLAAVREKYEPGLTALIEEMQEPLQVLETYAKEQRKNWDGKSIELANCSIGFRTNPPSVSKKKGITWEAIVSLMKSNKLLKQFVKVKEDIDKTAILKSQTDLKITKQLQSVGVSIEQDEQFFVNTKKEELQPA